MKRFLFIFLKKELKEFYNGFVIELKFLIFVVLNYLLAIKKRYKKLSV